MKFCVSDICWVRGKSIFGKLTVAERSIGMQLNSVNCWGLEAYFSLEIPPIDKQRVRFAPWYRDMSQRVAASCKFKVEIQISSSHSIPSNPDHRFLHYNSIACHTIRYTYKYFMLHSLFCNKSVVARAIRALDEASAGSQPWYCRLVNGSALHDSRSVRIYARNALWYDRKSQTNV